MEIDEHIDSLASQLPDQLLHEGEIRLVVPSPLRLRTGPHETQANDVPAKLLKYSQVFVGQRRVRIEVVERGNVRLVLDDHIFPMEITLTTVSIKKWKAFS